MMPARWTRGGAPTTARSSIARGAAGSLLVALAGALTGCAVPVVPAAPVTAPAAIQAGDRPEPCRFLSQATVADLSGDQRTQLVGSANTCSFTVGGRFTYQISVQPDANGRFESERDRLFKNSVPVQGVGDEAFYRDGTAITVLGARKGDTYLAVTLVPAVSDPAGAGGSPLPGAEAQAQGQVDQAQAALADAADADGDGVVDADQDADGQVDDGAAAAAVTAADADGDGAVDDDVAAAVQAVAAAADGADGADAGDDAGDGGARNAAAPNAAPGDVGTTAAAAAANAAGNAASVSGGGDDVAEAAAAQLGGIVDITEAKARLTDIAQAVADSV